MSMLQKFVFQKHQNKQGWKYAFRKIYPDARIIMLSDKVNHVNVYFIDINQPDFIHILKNGKIMCHLYNGGLNLCLDIDESWSVVDKRICPDCLRRRNSYPVREDKIQSRLILQSKLNSDDKIR